MTQPNYQLGIKCRLFRNTASYNSPTWTAINNVSDAAVNPEWDFAEGNTRGSRVKRGAKTLLGLTVSGKVLVDHTDTNGYVALLAAVTSDTPVDLLVLDGDPSDSTLTGTLSGYRFDAHVTKLDQDQALGNVLFDAFEMKPALSANAPAKVSAAVTAGSPVYTYTSL